MLNINRTASIIIPTFNRAELLPRAIESALNQSYPCEVIVCDHGSVDNTPEVANKYKGQIIYIRKEKDSGPIACWKDGLENATGEVAVINYDDDWLAPTFMEKSIHFLEEDIGFVYCRVMIHHNKNTKIIKNFHPPYINPMDDIANYLLNINYTISPGCAIFRRKDAISNLLDCIPGASGKYGKYSGVGEDLLLFLLTSLDYPKYAHLPEPLANFLAHDKSITTSAMNSNNNELAFSYKHARNYFLKLIDKRPLVPFKIIIFWIKWFYKSSEKIKGLCYLILSIKNYFNK